ncbi:MAG: hypothetical protein JWO69_1551 [Thermoleophilia bacterium]|nr:hypothetical protein [Thermoleophilia bacterium]
MPRFIGSSLIGAAITLMCARVVAAFAAEWSQLRATGELALRLERRRVRHLARVAVTAGVPPTPDPLARRGVHAAVYAGRVQAGDVDDMGLLEAAMQAAARRRAEAIARHTVVVAASPTVAMERLAPVWTIGVALLGLGLTLVPLVRPLEAVAPWLAVAGVALVLVGWLGARRQN